ncbi:unnamed protein product [Caenorhabditis brenneri]
MNPQHPHSYHPYARQLRNQPDNSGPATWIQSSMARLEQEVLVLRQANFHLCQQANGLANELRQAVALNKKLDFQQNQFLDLQSNLQLSNAYCAFMQNEYHKEVQEKERVMKEFEEYKQRHALLSPAVQYNTQGDAPPVLSPNPRVKIKQEVTSRPSSPNLFDSGFEDTLGAVHRDVSLPVTEPTVPQGIASMKSAGRPDQMEMVPVNWSVLDAAPQITASMEAGSMNSMMSMEQIRQVPMKETVVEMTQVEMTPVDWSVLDAAPKSTVPMKQVPTEQAVTQVGATVDWSAPNLTMPFFPLDQLPSVGMEITVAAPELVGSSTPMPTVPQISQDTVPPEPSTRSTPTSSSIEVSLPLPTVSPTLPTTVLHNSLPMMMYPQMLPFPGSPFAAATIFYHNNYAFLGEYKEYDLTSILFNPDGEQMVPQIVNRIYNTEAFYQSQKKRGDNKTMWRLLSKEKKAGLRKIMEKIRAAQTKQMQDGLIRYRRPSETSPFWRTVEGWNLRKGLETTGFV